MTTDTESELERERMRLAACGAAALANTPESIAKHRIGRDNPYWSASYGHVCDAVDSEIALRDERDAEAREFIGWLSADIPELNSVEVPVLADSWERFKVQRRLSREDSKP